MSLELCESYTLKGLITRSMAAGRRLFKINQSYEWLIQVASALAYLHGQKQPIIHRDVKPENILLKREPGPTRDGQLVCKLSDFGLHVEVASNRMAMLRRASKSLLKPSISGASMTGGGSPPASRPSSIASGGQHQATAAQALSAATQAGVEGAGGDAEESGGGGGGGSHRPPRPRSAAHRLILDGKPGSPFFKVSASTSFTRTQHAPSCASQCSDGGGTESGVPVAKGRRVLLQEMPLKRSEAPTPPASHPNGRPYFGMDEDRPGPSAARNGIDGAEALGRQSAGSGGSCGPATRPVCSPPLDEAPADIRPWGPLRIQTPVTDDMEGAEDTVAGSCHTPGSAVKDAAIVLETPTTIQRQLQVDHDPPWQPPQLPQRTQRTQPLQQGRCPPQAGAGGGDQPSAPHRCASAERRESRRPPPTVPYQPASGAKSSASTSRPSQAENEAAQASPAVNGEAKDGRETGGAAGPPDGAPLMTGGAELPAAVAVADEEASTVEDAGEEAVRPFETAAAAAAGLPERSVLPGGLPAGQNKMSLQVAQDANRGGGGDQKGDSCSSEASNHVGPGDRPASPAAAMSPTGASPTLSALLARHPDLVEPVCDGNPAAGLRNLGSLMRQLGITELKPLRRNEMEWVFGLTGMAGSFMYMAPEVFRKEPYNEKSDVFSFGVLLYELLACELLVVSVFNTGRAAKLGVREPRDYAALVARGYRPPRIQKLPDAAWELIEACWHQDPVERPSMAEVVSELERLADEQRLESARRTRSGRTASSASAGDGTGSGASASGGRAAASGAPAGMSSASQSAGKAVPRVRVDGGDAAVGCMQCVVS